MLVSIILPLYKGGKYVKSIIGDILVQTYKNWECIIVSNGPDQSEQLFLLRPYLADSRFRVIETSDSGLSLARNIGMCDARGEWLTFIDADDHISADHLQLLVDAIDEKTDIIVGGFKRVFVNGKKRYENIEDMPEDILFTADNMLTKFTRLGVAWNKLYRVSSLRRAGIDFDLHGVPAEDQLFNYSLALCGLRFKTIPMTGYHYIRPTTSTLCTKYHPNKEAVNRQVLDLKCKVLEKYNESGDLIAEFKTRTQFYNSYWAVRNLFFDKSPYGIVDTFKEIKRIFNDYDYAESANKLKGKNLGRYYAFYRALINGRHSIIATLVYGIFSKLNGIIPYFKDK